MYGVSSLGSLVICMTNIVKYLNCYNFLSYRSFVITVEVLLKAAGDAPIMVKKKWTVDGSKQVAYIVEFIRKYIKCEPKDSLVSTTKNDVLTWTTFSFQLWCNDFAFATHKWVVRHVATYQCSTRFVA